MIEKLLSFFYHIPTVCLCYITSLVSDCDTGFATQIIMNVTSVNETKKKLPWPKYSQPIQKHNNNPVLSFVREQRRT